MKKLYWRIRGYDSLTEIFGITVECGQFTEDQIKHLLKALTAKAGLGYREIVGAYAKRRTKIANNLLAVHKELWFPSYTCGSNPHFAAAVVGEDGQIARGVAKLESKPAPFKKRRVQHPENQRR
jgi:hypothetical protein